MHTCVHICIGCAFSLAAHFLRLQCLLITIKRRQLETETHQGIKGISVGWCVTELNHCLLFWYVLWFRKRSKEDVGATKGRLPGSVNKSQNLLWSGTGCRIIICLLIIIQFYLFQLLCLLLKQSFCEMLHFWLEYLYLIIDMIHL